MARGAIHDQVGGGFHRYTVDAAWRTPHFEKLLPDQALMSMVYLEAWQITKNDSYARVTRRTLDYAIRSLRLKSGAFGAGEDADSLVPAGGPALIEGAHYVWSRDEVMRLLGKQADVIAYYSVHSTECRFRQCDVVDVSVRYGSRMPGSRTAACGPQRW